MYGRRALTIKQSPFGSYLRKLRESQTPKMTQQQLAEAVGKVKMTISQIETGTNDPPQGEFLESIIQALNLNHDEEIALRDLSALARGTVPSDMLEYFTQSQSLRNAIRRAQEKKISESEWDNLIR